MQEEWKAIEDYPDYLVSNQGRVMSNKYRSTRVLRVNVHKVGYLSVCLCHENKIKRLNIHRLVANAFLTKPNSKEVLCVDHINQNKADNRACNLRWVDASTNMLNKSRGGMRSKYRGVRVKNGKWAAHKFYMGKSIRLGAFNSEEEAYELFESITEDGIKNILAERKKRRAEFQSPVKGVSWNAASLKWHAYKMIYGKLYHLGFHLTREKAEEAVAKFIKEHSI